MEACFLQRDIIDRYFGHLAQFGYMDDVKTMSALFSVLLLDTLNQFSEFITEEYITDINRIFTQLDCCDCFVNFKEKFKYPIDECAVKGICSTSVKIVNGVEYVSLGTTEAAFQTYVHTNFSENTTFSITYPTGVTSSNLQEILILRDYFQTPLKRNTPYYLRFKIADTTGTGSKLYTPSSVTASDTVWTCDCSGEAQADVITQYDVEQDCNQ